MKEEEKGIGLIWRENSPGFVWRAEHLDMHKRVLHFIWNTIKCSHITFLKASNTQDAELCSVAKTSNIIKCHSMSVFQLGNLICGCMVSQEHTGTKGYVRQTNKIIQTATVITGSSHILDLQAPFSTRVLIPGVGGHESPVIEALRGVIVRSERKHDTDR